MKLSGRMEHVHGGRLRGTVCRELMTLCGGGLTVAVVVLCGAPGCGFLNSVTGRSKTGTSF
jgi:hypothetical protein